MNYTVDAWRILTDDYRRAVIKDGFTTKEEASKWARRNTKLRSWLIQGYTYSCVIRFKERSFGITDNLF